MALEFRIDVNRDDLDSAKRFFEFIGGNTKDVIRIAINRAGPTIRTAASSEIRSQVRLSASYVRDRLTFRRATRANLEGRISAPKRGLLLSRFSTDALVAGEKVSWIKPPPVPARGIRVKIKPTGAAKVVGGGSKIDGKPFFMVLPNSRALAIVGRRAESGPRGGKIQVLYGPSLSQVFEDVAEDLTPQAAEVYARQQIDAMRYLLTKRSLPTS
jgi:hypothetical protein